MVSHSGTTTPPKTRVTFRRPYPKEFDDRVNFQRMRDGDILRGEETNIPDQGITFDNGLPIDEWESNGKRRMGDVKEEEENEEYTGHTRRVDPLIGAIEEEPRTPPRRASTSRSQGQPQVIEEEPTAYRPGNQGRTYSLDNPRDNVQGYGQQKTPFMKYEEKAKPTPFMAPVKNQPSAQRPTPGLSYNVAPQIAPYRANTIAPFAAPQVGAHGTQGRIARGYSMPPAAPPPTAQHGVLATEQYHRETMTDRLMRIIADALGTALIFPDGYKPYLKNDNVTKYSGSPKYNDIEEWLVIVAHRYALLKLGGGNTNTDRVRLLTLLDYLDGTVLTWFNNHVLNSK